MDFYFYLAYGSGKSKKEAKQNAALEFLEKVDSVNNQLSDSSSNRTITSTTPNRLSSITRYDSFLRMIIILSSRLIYFKFFSYILTLKLDFYEFSYSDL